MTTHFIQLAYVASSLTEKCTQLHQAFDIGPWLVARGIELVNHKLWGRPADNFTIDAAFAQSGELNIEVVELKSTGPNACSTSPASAPMWPPSAIAWPVSATRRSASSSSVTGWISAFPTPGASSVT
jgi:hypothetical protein